MNHIEGKLKQEIRNNGYIAVDKFMQIALFDEEYGYYIKKNPIGYDSDFLTSPEISVLFGETIGAFIITQIKNNLAKYDKLFLIELGSGKGTLINDILNIISKFNDIYQKISVCILDINPKLVEIQKNILIKHIDKIVWLNKIDDFENNFPNIFLANEFFDALPVKQFVKRQKNIKERVIKMDENDNYFFDEVDSDVPELIKLASEDYDENCIIEYSQESINHMNIICNKVLKNKGFTIIIDYGYTDFVTGDTLQSIYKHKPNYIFSNIGDADLTTHVNFRMLYNIALNYGLKDLYIQTQSEFLTSMGINERAQAITKNMKEKEKNDLLMRIDRLINNEQMGALFKCMIAEKF